MDSKLKCVFELPVESGTNSAPQENNVDATAEEKIKREVKSSPKVNETIYTYCVLSRTLTLCYVVIIGRIRTDSITS